MPSALIIAENTALSTNAYALVQNPMMPRGAVKNQPAKEFTTLSGFGGIQAPKEFYPTLLFTWPALVKSNSDHAALLAAFEARQYVKTGLDYYFGITGAKDSGFPFWNAAKYIQIRIVEVLSSEKPIDTDLDEVLFDMIVRAKWLDPD